MSCACSSKKFRGTIAVGGGFPFDATSGVFVDAVAIGLGVAVVVVVAVGVGVAVDIVVAVVLGLAVVGVSVVCFSFVLDDEALVPLKVSTTDILFICS